MNDNDFYIYISSKDFNGIDVCIPHETREGRWQLGLCEISYSKPKTNFPSIDICCNIISPNFEIQKSYQILRRMPPQRANVTMRFNPILYSHVMTTSIKRMQLYLKTDAKNLSAFDGVTFYCTLHCRRCDE
jgi:hypothetical protein